MYIPSSHPTEPPPSINVRKSHKGEPLGTSLGLCERAIGCHWPLAAVLSSGICGKERGPTYLRGMISFITISIFVYFYLPFPEIGNTFFGDLMNNLKK